MGASGGQATEVHMMVNVYKHMSLYRYAANVHCNKTACRQENQTCFVMHEVLFHICARMVHKCNKPGKFTSTSLSVFSEQMHDHSPVKTYDHQQQKSHDSLQLLRQNSYAALNTDTHTQLLTLLCSMRSQRAGLLPKPSLLIFLQQAQRYSWCQASRDQEPVQTPRMHQTLL